MSLNKDKIIDNFNLFIRRKVRNKWIYNLLSII